MIMEIQNQKVQYEIMTEEQHNENGYMPSYDDLIREAPNEEMRNKWIHCRDLFAKAEKTNPRLGRFAFACVFMVQKSCGHYEIYQVPSIHTKEELYKWIDEVELKGNSKCSSCHTNWNK